MDADYDNQKSNANEAIYTDDGRGLGGKRGNTLNVTDKDFQECGRIVTPRAGYLRIRSDPKKRVLKDGIYVILPQLNNKWILSIYRDRCLGTNELEITLDPTALALMSNDDRSFRASVNAWLEHQREELQNETARSRTTDPRIDSFDIGFTLSGAQEFLRRLARELEWPYPTWQVEQVYAQSMHRRRSAVSHMMEMAYQAAAASGTQRVEVAKNKIVRFASEDEFRAHIEALLHDPVCAITKLPLDLTFADSDLAPSLDRRDSAGHYEPGNLQVVARFVNRWKSDDDESNFQRLIDLVRQQSTPMSS